MNSERLEKLLQFLAEDPQDPFNLYALAHEYQQLSDTHKALEYFEKLLREYPDYLPTYYQAAKLYEDLNENEKAKQTYLKGLGIAREKGNIFTLRELDSAYRLFLMEGEEE